MWHYKNKIFTSEDIGPNVAFVYLLTHKITGKKYIGLKGFYSTRTLPPLKSAKSTRKRKIVTESTWQAYTGSGAFKDMPPSDFHREILHLAQTKSEAAYLELVEQIQRNVLMDDNYVNGIIQVRINASHLSKYVKRLKSEKSLI